MQGISIKLTDEDMGVPISDECQIKAKSPDSSYIQINLIEDRIDGSI